MEQRDEEGIPKTGRLASTSPNSQNIARKPIHLFDCTCEDCAKIFAGQRQTRTVSIRRYYIVPKGRVYLYIDLSQIEIRVLAWFTQDKRLLYCYANDLDVHQITADGATNGDRDLGKILGLSMQYGVTKIGLARKLPIYADDPGQAELDAEIYLERYDQTYPGVKIFRDRLASYMAKHSCMFVNPFGRPRRISEIVSSDRAEYAHALRKMMASIISGTSADLLKEIMLRCRGVLQAEYAQLPYDRRGRQVQPIHDEIVFALPVEGCAQVIPKLYRCFTDWPMFEERGVPIRASASLTTTTWEDKKEINVYPDGSFGWKK